MEKEKKPVYKKWWFWVIVVFVVLAIIGASGGGKASSKTALTSGNTSDTSTSSGEQNSTEATNATKKYNIGEIYKNGSIAIKYVSLDDNFKGYNQYADVKSGCKIVKAEFEFENVGSTDVLASAYNFNCYADGYDCEKFWSVDDSGFSSTLSAGKKAKGSVYFQVPENAMEVTLEYETNIWTSNKVEFIVK